MHASWPTAAGKVGPSQMRVGNKAITANHDRLPKEGRKDDERERKSDGEIRARQGKEGGKAGRQGGIELSRTDRAIFEKWTTERERERLHLLGKFKMP